MRTILGVLRAAIPVAVLACSVATAEEPGVTTATVSPTVDPRTLDREGKPIYGFELMSETEVSGFRSLLFSIKDPVAREEARAAHRKAMDKRAAERGVAIKQ